MKKNNLKNNKIKTFNIDISSKDEDVQKQIFNFLTKERYIQISEKDCLQLKFIQQDGQVHVDVPVEILKRKVEITKFNFELSLETVVYEDDGIIVVNKPSGLPSQATLDPARDHLYAAVQRWVEKEAFLHHRLDVETSGLVLFAKKRSLNKDVGDMFQNKTIRKTYMAIVSPVPDESSFAVENYLAKMKQKILKVHSVKSGGDPARTEFEIVQSHQQAALVEASPLTGRTHQIRVHLSEYGCPIVGDQLYGGILNNAHRTMLHAFQLEFIHPVTQESMTIQAPPPPDFALCLKQLGLQYV